MAELINLSRFVSGSNGKTYANGLVSGFDSKAVIEAKSKPRESQIKKIEDKVTLQQNELKALSELKTKMQALNKAATALANDPLTSVLSGSVFDKKMVASSTEAQKYFEATLVPEQRKAFVIGPDATNLQQGFVDGVSIVSVNGAGQTFTADMPSSLIIDGVGINLDEFSDLDFVIESINAQLSAIRPQLSARKVSAPDGNYFIQVETTIAGNPGNFDCFMTPGPAAVNALQSSSKKIPGNEANLGSHQIEVVDLAKTARIKIQSAAGVGFNSTGAVVTADGDGATFEARADSIQITTESGAYNIALDAGDNLDTVVEKINTQLMTQGLVHLFANKVVAPDNRYFINIESSISGQKGDFSCLVKSGLDNLPTSTTHGANAIIKIDGITYENFPANEITSVIPGVSLNLLDANPGQQYNIQIVNNPEESANGIIDFIAAYNELQKFVAIQQERKEDGTGFKDTAYLKRSPVLQQAISVLSNATAAVRSLPAGALRSLSDVGISFDKVLKTDEAPEYLALSLDKDKFTANLKANYNEVRKLFEVAFTATASDLRTAGATIMLSRLTSKVAYDGSPGVIHISAANHLAAFDGGPGNLIEFDINATGADSFTLTGRVGTMFEGLELLLNRNGNSNDLRFDFSFSQGLADIIRVTSNPLTDLQGSIDTEILTHQRDIDTNKATIEQRRKNLADYQNRLRKEYAKIEAKAYEGNQTSLFLDGLMDSLFGK